MTPLLLLPALTTSALTSILGWVSIACWIVVYSPQIYENYSLQSGDGLSVAFVVVWLIGDLCNLVGAVLGDLLGTVIVLACYYSLCDIILLCQVYYYRWKKSERNKARSTSSNESQPLLHRQDSRQTQETIQQATSTNRLVLKYAFALLFVILTGLAAWYISNMINDDVDEHHQQRRGHSRTPAWVIQLLGWTSAVMYLGARIPQIHKNTQTHCDGLSPALFFFAIIGNLTYALSIVVAAIGISGDEGRRYMWTNGGWLAGSALTVFLDFIVLGQFFYYRSRRLESQRAAASQ